MSVSTKCILFLGTLVLIRLLFLSAEEVAEAKADEAIVRNLEAMIIQEMPLDGSLTGKYGEFVRLSDSALGFCRYRDTTIFEGRIISEGLKFKRVAVFTKGSLPVSVTLHCAPSTTLGGMKIEITQWYCPENKLPLTINARAPGEPKTLIH